MALVLRLLVLFVAFTCDRCLGFCNANGVRSRAKRFGFLFSPANSASICCGRQGSFFSHRDALLFDVNNVFQTLASSSLRFRSVQGLSIRGPCVTSMFAGRTGKKGHPTRQRAPGNVQQHRHYPDSEFLRDVDSTTNGFNSAGLFPSAFSDVRHQLPQFLCPQRRAKHRLPLGIPVAEAAAQNISLSRNDTKDIRNRILTAAARGAKVPLTVSSLGSFLMPDRAKLLTRRNELLEKDVASKGVLLSESDDVNDTTAVIHESQNSPVTQSSAHLSRRTMRFRLLQQLLLPHSELPEIAVAGRSNVGKSSLLNCFFDLCKHSQQHLQKKPMEVQTARARTSKTPGRTRAIDMYQISRLLCEGPNSGAKERREMHLSRQNAQPSGGLLILADFPGYGYTEGIGDVLCRQISLTLRVYIEHRQQLKHILVLIDGRRGVSCYDRELIKYLNECRISATIVITKCDTMDGQMIQDILCSLSYLKRIDIPKRLSKLRIDLLASRLKHCDDDENTNAHQSGHTTKSIQEAVIPFEHRAQLPLSYYSERPSNERGEVQPGRRPMKVFLVSARTGEGVQQLWRHVLQVSTEASLRTANDGASRGLNASKCNNDGPADTSACLPEDLF